MQLAKGMRVRCIDADCSCYLQRDKEYLVIDTKAEQMVFLLHLENWYFADRFKPVFRVKTRRKWIMGSTAKEVREQAARGEGCLGKAADGEPVFVLRAQDSLAAETVERWALRARAVGVNNDKVQEAFAIAEQMLEWHNRKIPD